jgi:hypothetical protein
VSGNTAIVGVPLDGMGAADQQGSAYVYVRSGATWTLQAKLVANDGAARHRIGASVALEGDTAVVAGFPDSGFAGAAYVFVRSGTTWTQQAKLTSTGASSGAHFGDAVSLSGNTIVVGAPWQTGGGAAFVFTRSGTTWSEQAKLVASDIGTYPLFADAVAVDADTALVAAGGAAYVFVRSGTIWTEQKQLFPSNGTVAFGSAVALDANTALVGAMSDTVGANGQQGSAFVFVRSGTVWTEQTRLVAPDGEAQDYFGRSVALSGDTAIAGGIFSREVAYAFVRSGTTWSFQHKFTSGSGATEFGMSVAIDGNTVVIGDSLAGTTSTSYGPGAAFVHVRGGTTWSEQAVLDSGQGAFGYMSGHSASLDGDTAVIGAPQPGLEGHSGEAFVFTRSGTTWTRQARLAPNPPSVYSQEFGVSVSVSGNTTIVGEPERNNDEGAASVFVRSGTTWSEQTRLQASDRAENWAFGIGVAIDGDTALVGAYGADNLRGAAYVFVRAGTTWSEQAKLVASDGASGDGFGASVSLDRDTAVIGTLTVAYVFVRNGTTWSEQKKLAPTTPATEHAGTSVSVSADTAVIGRLSDTVGGKLYQGAVYIFARSGTTWSEQPRLLASDGAASDHFGSSVVVAGDNIVVGANGDSVGPVLEAGSAYLFTRSGATWTEQPKIVAADGQTGDSFGDSVALDGDTVLIGAAQVDGPAPLGNRAEGRAYVFRIPGISGGGCSVGTDCESGFCVSGICCNTACGGACDECSEARGARVDGVCAPVTAGSPGAPACAPQACNGVSTACVACATDADCTPDRYCAASGACQSRKALASTCDDGAGADCKTADCRVCASAGGCVDGFCCNATCSGACDTCAAASGAPANGTCGPATAGTSGSTGACGPAYVCDGTSASCPGACTTDSGCASGYYCNAAGTCVKQLVVGANCDLAPGSLCKEAGCRVCGTAGGCINGVCCNTACSGECESCSPSTGGICAARGAGTGCGTGFLCSGTSGACPTSCASSSECAAGYYCDSGTGKCAVKKADGSPCANGSECINTYCADGFCCDTACDGCSACAAALKENGLANGVCGAAKKNTDPHSACQSETQSGCGQTGQCNGAGACQFYVDIIAPCGPTTCSGNKVTGKVCIGQYTCGDSTQGLDCGQLKCTGGQCAPCVTNADCLDPSNYFCDAGDCKARKTQGAVCTTNAECGTTFCADGVCCETACNGQCEWCGDATAPGVCKAAPQGAPQGGRNACAGTGTCTGACDGAKRDGCVFPGNATTCGAASCNNDTLVPAATCDGTGSCAPGTPQDCGGYTCDSAGGACKTSCATKADCRLGAVCDTTTGTGTCNAAGATCSGAYSVKANDGTVSFCSGYRCVSGACQQQCSASTDCATGYSCSANACVATDSGAAGTGGASASGGAAGSSGAGGDGGSGGAPATGGATGTGGADGGLVTAGASGAPIATAADEGGCGCRVPARSSTDSPAGAAVLATLGLAMAARRRRSARVSSRNGMR